MLCSHSLLKEKRLISLHNKSLSYFHLITIVLHRIYLDWVFEYNGLISGEYSRSVSILVMHKILQDSCMKSPFVPAAKLSPIMKCDQHALFDLILNFYEL